MRRFRKKYERPLKPFDKQRIEEEREVLKKFGLKKKGDVWRAQTLLRKYRQMARKLVAKKDKEMEKVLVEKLIKLGLLSEGSGLDDVLGLTMEIVLERRLQTIVLKKGLANTVKQARQFITHGHVTIGDKKIVYPSYLVSRDEESSIQLKDVKVQKKAGSEQSGG